MRRINVVGTSGSGKSTVAREIAVRLGCPAVELDASFHQEGWTRLAEDEFRSRIAAIAAEERWVIDGNYSSTRDIVWGRADTVVWLDLPRSAVMRQVTRRTVGRALTGRRLWNGNRERLATLVNVVPEDNMILWAWTTYDRNVEKFERLMCDPVWEHLVWKRLRSADDIDRYLASLS